MTFVEHIGRTAAFSFSEEVTYQSPYDESQCDQVVALCERTFGAHFTDNPSVRLDAIEHVPDGKTTLRLTPVGFFGFLTTHYAWLNRETLLAQATDQEKRALYAFFDRLEADGIPHDIESILQRPYLANMLAISCLVRDEEGRALLVVRNKSVGISSGFVSVSATGVIEREDLVCGMRMMSDPVRACAQREVFEELGIKVPLQDFELVAVVCGEEKLQPVALVNAKVKDIARLTETIQANPGFASENTSLLICDAHEIGALLASPDVQITEAGRAHLAL